MMLCDVLLSVVEIKDQYFWRQILGMLPSYLWLNFNCFIWLMEKKQDRYYSSAMGMLPVSYKGS